MRPFRRRHPRLGLVVVLALSAAMLLRCGCWFWPGGRETAPPAAALQEGPCTIDRVVDGDTIVVRQRSGKGLDGPFRTARVRLLGIDTPETVKPNHPVEKWGPEATRFAERFLAGGKARLELDKRRIDKYDRFLAYVYVEDRMLNEELVRAGLARASHYPGDSAARKRQFDEAEDEARAARRGIWSDKLLPTP